MIISFSVENYRSINKKLTLSFERSTKISKKDLPHNYSTVNKSELLNSLIMYGRNASGKSNILRAFKAFQTLISNSDEFRLNREITDYEPFLLNTLTFDEPTTFEIEFFDKKNIRYLYLFSFNKEKILTENLYYFLSRKKTKLFERNGLNFSYEASLASKLQKIESLLLPNQLLLSKSSKSNIEYLNDVFTYLSSITYISNDSSTDLDSLEIIDRLIKSDSRIFGNLKQLIKTADTNIENFTIEKAEAESLWFPQNYSRKEKEEILQNPPIYLRTSHYFSNKDGEIKYIDFNFEEESLGTKKLFTVGVLIIKALLNGHVIIIDELDKSLHSLLTKLLISLFHSKDNNLLSGQLVFATHDSALLDLQLFRRDQIVFVDKKYEGNTFLYKLSDFTGVRNDIPLDQWYLSGRFGATPVLNIFELDYEHK